MKISGVYKITNLETNECYIGSSKDVKNRWATHKYIFTTKKQPNKKLYSAFQQYGLDKFSFEILEETTKLKEREQYYIDLLKPIYNSNRANGFDLERYKEYHLSNQYKEKRNKRNNQFCNYNGETITLCALAMRFSRAGIEHSTLEAKKYLLKQ